MELPLTIGLLNNFEQQEDKIFNMESHEFRTPITQIRRKHCIHSCNWCFKNSCYSFITRPNRIYTTLNVSRNFELLCSQRDSALK